MRFFFMAMAVAATALAWGAGVAAAQQPNSSGACRNWQQVVRADGVAFQSKGACVSYVARGGYLVQPAPPAQAAPPLPTCSVVDVPYSDPVQFDVMLSCTGYQPGSAVSLSYAGPDGTPASFAFPSVYADGTAWAEIVIPQLCIQPARFVVGTAVWPVPNTRC
jgi:hypothetical protein